MAGLVNQASGDHIPSERTPLIDPPASAYSSRRVVINVPQEDSGTPKIPPVTNGVSEDLRAYRGGIAVSLYITFLSSFCFSIVLPSIWLYIQYIEGKHGNKNPAYSLNGWAVAVNSGGSFLASPLIGAWGDRRSAKEVLAVTLIFMIAGNVAYSLATNYWMLLAARFVVGAATANFAISQTYLAYASTTKNRGVLMALNSGFSVLGFIAGPAFASVFSFVDFNIREVEVNSNTAPGFFAAICSMLSLFSLIFLKEIPNTLKKAAKLATMKKGSGIYNAGGSVKDISQIIQQTVKHDNKIPWLPVTICLIATFVYTWSFTVFESIGTQYSKAAYGWGSRENGIFFAALGAGVVVSLLILQLFLKVVNERVALIWTSVQMLGCWFIVVNYHTLGYVSKARFIASAALGGTAFSVACALMTTIYSKILESLDQGMMMGWLLSVGSIARILGPLVATYTLDYTNTSVVFIEMLGLCVIPLFMFTIGYRKLAPRLTKT
eukprot:TRINITY_DN5778_c0_g1_i1.p1 TRINITY_DN5778_c0_g1~~TRINITY_DN5778_c0_g1_i1.p1  ORF type:complete len:493 (+),score=90.41 TRINITY_DN5778_c0_g1_i1:69-1547(+)